MKNSSAKTDSVIMMIIGVLFVLTIVIQPAMALNALQIAAQGNMENSSQIQATVQNAQAGAASTTAATSSSSMSATATSNTNSLTSQAAANNTTAAGVSALASAATNPNNVLGSVQSDAATIGAPTTIIATTIGTATSALQSVQNRVSNPVLNYDRDQINALLAKIQTLEQHQQYLGTSYSNQLISLQKQVIRRLQSIDSGYMTANGITTSAYGSTLQAYINQLYGLSNTNNANTSAPGATIQPISTTAIVPTPLSDNILSNIIQQVETADGVPAGTRPQS